MARWSCWGCAPGRLVFFAGDWLLDRRGAERRKSPTGMQQDATSGALVLGALLDGIPESAAIGVSLLGGEGVGIAVVVAVFLSNIPEGMSASAGMKASGRSSVSILALWGSVAVASTVAAALGYGAARRRIAGSGGLHPDLRRRRDPHDARRHDDSRGGQARRPVGGAGDGARLHLGVLAVGGVSRLTGRARSGDVLVVSEG